VNKTNFVQQRAPATKRKGADAVVKAVG